MEIEIYFDALRKYAFGDLALLHKLSAEAEAKETGTYTTSSTTTGETTKYSTGSYSAAPPQVICRATIPFTLMIFSCIDILGYLVRTEGSHRETAKNIIAFFSKVNNGPSADELECLINIYRHGLAHNYFPKLGQSISYHSKNPDKLFLKNEIGTQIILNVNMLEKFFVIGFMAITGSSELYSTMEKRLQELNNHYNEHERCKSLDL